MNKKTNSIKIINIIFYIVIVVLILFFLQTRIRNFIKEKNLTNKEIAFSKIVDINDNEYNLLNSDILIIFVFWASWCTPCILEIPVLNDIHKDMSDRVLLFAINIEDNINIVKNTIVKYNISYPVILDKDNNFSSFFKVSSIPTIIFIKNKKIIKVKYGYSQFLKNEIHKILK